VSHGPLAVGGWSIGHAAVAPLIAVERFPNAKRGLGMAHLQRCTSAVSLATEIAPAAKCDRLGCGR